MAISCGNTKAHRRGTHQAADVAEVRACYEGTRMPADHAGSDRFNREWAEYKNEYARREADQERAAYEAEMRRDEELLDEPAWVGRI